jgi:hypothetical protein
LAGKLGNAEHLTAVKKADICYTKAMEKTRPMPTTIDLTETQFQSADNYVMPTNVTNSRTEGCIGDFRDDNYGAKWFVTNFCSFCRIGALGMVVMAPPAGHGSSIGLNVTTPLDCTPYLAKTFCSRYIMAAGYDADAFLTMSVRYNGTTTNYKIPARHVSFFSCGSAYDRKSWSLTPNNYTWPDNTSCSRTHFASIWDKI